ncbi:hypothetical protein C2G38_2244007 [Gigaspora rosea]|uniref:Uncharacterized protein n=1 Tax=Gigaspora rosea TaxID=44941 RepID=A0A397VN81_9GLOM|nr:hypothetical protein C2G38_2244007 [Gigaspora rosea]
MTSRDIIITMSPSLPTFMDAGDIMEHEMKLNEYDQATKQKIDDPLRKRQIEKSEIPTKKLDKMMEKTRRSKFSMFYVVVGALAIMFAWLKFKGMTEKWKFWQEYFV